MLAELVKKKTDRIWEAADLSLRLTKDFRSRTALLSCYAGIVRDPLDRSEVSLELDAFRTAFPIRMRRSDIFTLKEIFFDREYAIHSALPKSPLVLDCGANIGLSVIWFLARWPGARVHAFEPERENFRLLAANVGHRSDVVLEEAAVGRESGSIELHVASHGAMHSVKDASQGSRTVEVQAFSLADYLERKRIDRVDVLKLDVEGNELEALYGLGDRIDDVGVIVGELHGKLVDEEELYRYVEAKGFRRVKRMVLEDDTHMFELARPT